jgi:hypothetical protein
LVGTPEGWLLWSENLRVPGKTYSACKTRSPLPSPTCYGSGCRRWRARLVPACYRGRRSLADYLRGRHHWNRRTPDSLVASIRCDEQALARDPNCAPAHTGVADTLMVMALNDQAPTFAVMPRARAEARKALEPQPGRHQALASLGCVRSVCLEPPLMRGLWSTL